MGDAIPPQILALHNSGWLRQCIAFDKRQCFYLCRTTKLVNADAYPHIADALSGIVLPALEEQCSAVANADRCFSTLDSALA